MKSFIRNIPTSIEGQKDWIIRKAIERHKKGPVCIDCLSNELPVHSIEELYELVTYVCLETDYYETGKIN
jgi:hypothetical protein